MTHDPPAPRDGPCAASQDAAQTPLAAAAAGDAATRVATGVSLAGVLGSLALSALSLSTLNINWDEFLRLSAVHRLLRGEALGFLQGAYAHAFRWLPRVAGHEVEQIVAARGAMLVLHAASLAALYAVARRFASVWAALAAVAAVLAASYVAEHGTSFRYDPMLALALAAALVVMVRAPLRAGAAFAVGGLLALATAITVKTVFFLPTFAALAVLDVGWRHGWRSAVSWAARAAAAFGCVLLAAYLLHELATAGLSGEGRLRALAGDGRRYFPLDGLVPRWDYLGRFLVENPLVVLLSIAGMACLTSDLLAGPPARRMRALAALSLGLPLLSLLVYRNAFPYFYVPLLAFAAPWTAVAMDRSAAWLAQRSTLGADALRIGLVAVLVTLAVLARLPHLTDQQHHQRLLVQTVHDLFPEPVPYLDRCRMIGSFLQQGFFMSSLGLAKYRDGAYGELRSLLAPHPPVFVVANHPALIHALSGYPADLHPALRLAPSDARHLRDHYVHHWGLLFVAGKALDLEPASARGFTIAVAGPYTLESEHPVRIDGAWRDPLSVLHLERGRHEVFARAATRATLRWGSRLQRPDAPPPREPLFVGF